MKRQEKRKTRDMAKIQQKQSEVENHPVRNQNAQSFHRKSDGKTTEQCTEIETSLTDLRQQMRSGDLRTYLSLNRLLNGIVLCSISQIFVTRE